MLNCLLCCVTNYTLQGNILHHLDDALRHMVTQMQAAGRISAYTNMEDSEHATEQEKDKTRNSYSLTVYFANCATDRSPRQPQTSLTSSTSYTRRQQQDIFIASD